MAFSDSSLAPYRAANESADTELSGYKHSSERHTPDSSVSEYMNRRAVLAGLSGCASLSLAGCVAEPGTNGGLLEVLDVDKPSRPTVTPATDERIRSLEPLQTALDRAGSGNGTADLRLDPSEFDATASALTPLPWYERNGESHASGIYLRHETEIFVASLWPYCTDSLLGSAESERGVYGRGGCLDPAERPGDSLSILRKI